MRWELTDKICAPVQNRKPRRQPGSGFKGALDSQTIQIGAVDSEAAPFEDIGDDNPLIAETVIEKTVVAENRTSQCP